MDATLCSMSSRALLVAGLVLAAMPTIPAASQPVAHPAGACHSGGLYFRYVGTSCRTAKLVRHKFLDGSIGPRWHCGSLSRPSGGDCSSARGPYVRWYRPIG